MARAPRLGFAKIGTRDPAVWPKIVQSPQHFNDFPGLRKSSPSSNHHGVKSSKCSKLTPIEITSIPNIFNPGCLPAPTPRPLVSPVDLSSLPDCQYSPATEHELVSVYVDCDLKLTPMQ